ncbi:MAG: hypothetical protein IJU68_01580 [Bacteroidales bacterium]|nr:hypothetical protein [Bacteroidales bacterium]
MAEERNIITETTAEQYFVEVLTPQIDKKSKDYVSIQQNVSDALERPVTLGEKAVSSFIAAITKPMEKMVSSTKCDLPDTESLEIRIADVVNMFGKNKESKQMMKAYIRENEQRLLRLRRGDRLSPMTGDEKEK